MLSGFKASAVRLVVFGAALALANVPFTQSEEQTSGSSTWSTSTDASMSATLSLDALSGTISPDMLPTTTQTESGTTATPDLASMTSFPTQTNSVPQVCGIPRGVALTFELHDSFYDSVFEVLDYLKWMSVPGAFFMSVDYLSDYRSSRVVDRIVLEGHTLGFLYTGNVSMGFNDSRYILESKMKQFIVQSGVQPKFARLPQSANGTVLETLFKQYFSVIGWNVDIAEGDSCRFLANTSDRYIPFNDRYLELSQMGHPYGIISRHLDKCETGASISTLIQWARASLSLTFRELSDCTNNPGRVYGVYRSFSSGNSYSTNWNGGNPSTYQWGTYYPTQSWSNYYPTGTHNTMFNTHSAPGWPHSGSNTRNVSYLIFIAIIIASLGFGL